MFVCEGAVEMEAKVYRPQGKGMWGAVYVRSAWGAAVRGD